MPVSETTVATPIYLPTCPTKYDLRWHFGDGERPIHRKRLKKIILEVLPSTPYDWEEIKRLHYLPAVVAKRIYEKHEIFTLMNLPGMGR